MSMVFTQYLEWKWLVWDTMSYLRKSPDGDNLGEFAMRQAFSESYLKNESEVCFNRQWLLLN